MSTFLTRPKIALMIVAAIAAMVLSIGFTSAAYAATPTDLDYSFVTYNEGPALTSGGNL